MKNENSIPVPPKDFFNTAIIELQNADPLKDEFNFYVKVIEDYHDYCQNKHQHQD